MGGYLASVSNRSVLPCSRRSTRIHEHRQHQEAEQIMQENIAQEKKARRSLLGEDSPSEMAKVGIITDRPEWSTLSRAYTEYPFCDPLPPYQMSTLKMLILRPRHKMAMHHE